MNKSNNHKIEVTKKEFKKINKGKQTIIIRLNDEENQKIKINDKIIIKKKINKFSKKVKELHTYTTLEELINNVDKKQLGYKNKDNINYDDLLKNYNEEDIKKYGILGIELQPKKHIFRIVLLGILIVWLLFVSYRFISNEINKKIISGTLNKLSKERTDYVFVEINPSFVLVVKNNKVTDIGCLNDDCMSFYSEIEPAIKEKTIEDSIDIIYNMSKEKGFDISEGIKIKTTVDLQLDDKNYIKVDYITDTEKNNLLSQLKNNEKIKENNNDEYYAKLWDKLKTDSDYGEVYSCDMYDNELKCYIKEEMFLKEDITLANATKFMSNQEKIARVLYKYGIENKSETLLPTITVEAAYVYINDREFWCQEDGTCILDGGSGDDFIYFTLFKSDYALNLLKPNEVMQSLLFGNSESVTIGGDPNVVSADTPYVEKVKICDINKNNCTDIYNKCDGYKKNCQRITKEVYEEYNPPTIKFDTCYSSKSGNGEYICENDNQDLFYKCSNENHYEKDCTLITKEEYENLRPYYR